MENASISSNHVPVYSDEQKLYLVIIHDLGTAHRCEASTIEAAIKCATAKVGKAPGPNLEGRMDELIEQVANIILEDGMFPYTAADKILALIQPAIEAEARQQGRQEVAAEIIKQLDEWEDNGPGPDFSSAGYIAANRGHVWPYIEALRAKYGIKPEAKE